MNCVQVKCIPELGKLYAQNRVFATSDFIGFPPDMGEKVQVQYYLLELYE